VLAPGALARVGALLAEADAFVAALLRKGIVDSIMSFCESSQTSSTCLKHMGQAVLRWYHCMMHLEKKKRVSGEEGREAI